MADDVPAPVPPLLSMDEQEQQKKRLKVESLLGEYAGAGDGEIAARMDDRNDHEAAQATPTSAQPDEETPRIMRTFVDVERIRIKLEMARMRASGLLSEIPSGRVFDSAPEHARADVAHENSSKEAVDEPAHDSTERLNNDHEVNSADQFVKKEPIAIQPVAQVTENETEIAREGLTGHPNRTDTPVTSSEKHAEKELVSTEKREVETLHDSDTKERIKEEVAGSESCNGHAPADAIPHTPADEADGINQQPVSETSTIAPTAEHEAASENEHHSALVVKTAPDVVTTHAEHAPVPTLTKRTVPDENRPLNEYLVSELEIFSSYMLGANVTSNVTKNNRVAHANTLQLYTDHTRALADFDADCRRSHFGAKGWANVSSVPSSVVDAVVMPTDLAEKNPFSKSASEVNNHQWLSLLEHVIPSSSGVKRNELRERDNHTNEWSRRGLNGIVVSHNDRDKHRIKIRLLMTELTQMQCIPGLHIVVASNNELFAWQKVLTSENQAEFYPYWGEKADRETSLRTLRDKYLSRQKATPHVLLTSYDIFAEDVGVLSMVQWQLAVIEVPEVVTFQEQLDSVWMKLLSLRARQRVVIYHEEFHIDARKLLHFLLPGLFSSRRNLLAWSCAAFDADFIHRLCDVLRSFVLLSEPDEVNAFVGKVFQHTLFKSDQELSILNLLDRHGMVRPSVATHAKEGQSSVETKRLRNQLTAASHGRPRARKLSGELSVQSPKVVHKKRRGSDGTPRSRKRISRCGKCAGCLSEDCMVCGHCKDMKKYGGPGLRKQSCKNRKCINPKSWGLAKKEKKSKPRKQEKEQPQYEDEEMASEKYESEPEDDGALSYYSQDSDRESTSGPIVLSETVHSDSDAHNMLKSSEELPPSPREVSLESDERLQDNSLDGSDAGFGSKSSRTRVMRCGKCAGCTASDCMKCRHCLDMKKYGGPGLRKQSCKNRKCIIPKVVLLNQSKDDEFVDEKGNIVYPDYYDGADMLDGAELYHTGALDARTSMISVIQECEIFIDRHLVFTCDFCVARFSSKDLLDLHERVEHSLATIQVDALEREASRMFLHPIQQNCFINAQLRERKQIQRACPRAYVKLEGRDFQYFMMQPCIVLGRLSSWWLNFYQNLVLTNATGLGGGDVDCHIGNDTTIDSKHALIAWSSNKKSFTIECLSDRTPISVNGQKVSFESMPMTLESRNLVEVGSCAFYFLLPKAPSENKDQWSCRQPAQDQVGTLPRSELQAWLHATIRKRRASAASGDDSKLDHASDVAAIKKRCQERLAMSS